MTTELLNPARDGGNRSTEFNKLMEETYRKVYDMAYRLSGSRSDAEDLTQEAYYRAYRSFGSYEGGRPFENWIFRIVTRVFLDLLRTRRRRVKVVSYDEPVVPRGDEPLSFEFADTRPNPEAQLMSVVFREDLCTALASLTESQRSLLWQADIDEQPYEEIARGLDTPVGTVRSRLHRTHKLMRSGLERARRK
jgi:RNA polymerase sigma-70 factor (ECF subfamily)